MNYEEQKEKTYAEVIRLMELTPFRYKTTRKTLKIFIDFFNNETTLIE